MWLLNFAVTVVLLAEYIQGRMVTYENEVPVETTFQQQSRINDEFTNHTRKVLEEYTKDSPMNWIPMENNCHHHSYIFIQGSCRGFYRCYQESILGFSISSQFCPPGQIFDDLSESCHLLSLLPRRPKCLSLDVSTNAYINNPKFTSTSQNKNIGLSIPAEPHTHNRHKREVQPSTSSLVNDFLLRTEKLDDTSYVNVGGDMNLRTIRYKLTGIMGNINQTPLTELQDQVMTNEFTEAIQLIKNTKEKNIRCNFDRIQNLIKNGILDDHAIMPALHGMLSNKEYNEVNLALVKDTLKEVEYFINQEIIQAKNYIEKAFEMAANVNTSTDSIIYSLASKLFNLTGEFTKKLYHLQSANEDEQAKIIERSNGYMEYLSPSNLQNTLTDVMNQMSASREDSSKNVLLLELLVQGVQIQVNVISFVLSTTTYIASAALRDRDLEKFNAHITKRESILKNIKEFLGYSRSTEGLLNRVDKVITDIEEATLLKSDNFVNFISEKKINNEQIKSDIDTLIERYTLLEKPERITQDLVFTESTIKLPISKWEAGKTVSYAIQFSSGNKISPVGDWSEPHKIGDKAHPIVNLPETRSVGARFVYRRFDHGRAELVAVLNDNSQTSFRDINKDLINALSQTTTDGIIQTEKLLEDGADVDFKFVNELTPLHFAAKVGNTEALDILTAKNASTCAKGSNNQEPIHFAAFSGKPFAIDELISRGANVDVQTKSLGFSPLHIAASKDHESASSMLLVEDASVLSTDSNGLTPFHLAVIGGGNTLKNFLRYDDLNINAATPGGLTPLHLASANTEENIIYQLLYDDRISKTSLNDKLISPIHLATIYDNVNALVYLIQQRYSVSATDRDGSTPLHYAAFYGSTKAALVLIQIDLTLKNVLNNDNETALDIAYKYKRESIANILQKDINSISDIIKNELGDKDNIPLTSDCSKEAVKELEKNSEEICMRVGFVDSYVNLVQFMIPIQVSYTGLEDYSKLFSDYNEDLLVAKNHSKLWRDGDSIIQGITITFKAAKNFEPEFREKYAINKRNVKSIGDKVEDVDEINNIMAEISKLEGQINEYKNMSALTENALIKSYFLKSLNDSQRKKSELEYKLTNDYVVLLELKELVKFLKFVKNDAQKISAEAIRTRDKIDTFKRYLQHDKGAFERHKTVADNALENLEEERAKKKQELAEAKAQKVRLEREIKEKREEILNIQKKGMETYNSLMEERRKLLDKATAKSKTLSILGAVLAPLLIGIPLLMFADSEENSAIQAMQDTLEDHKKQMEINNNQIRFLEEEVTRQQEILGSTDTEEDWRMLFLMKQLTGDLQDLSYDAATLEKAVAKALTGVNALRQVFEDITQNLSDMIEKAESASDAAERRDARYFAYEGIADLECNWSEAYIKIMDTKECTRNLELINLLASRY